MVGFGDSIPSIFAIVRASRAGNKFGTASVLFYGVNSSARAADISGNCKEESM
jgi:hypothetical protein